MQLPIKSLITALGLAAALPSSTETTEAAELISLPPIPEALCPCPIEKSSQEPKTPPPRRDQGQNLARPAQSNWMFRKSFIPKKEEPSAPRTQWRRTGPYTFENPQGAERIVRPREPYREPHIYPWLWRRW